MRSRWLVWLCVCLGSACAPALADSPWLYGLHWYGTDGDVENLTGGKGVWLVETVMTWDSGWSASSQLSKFQTAVSRGHSIICRLQPAWGLCVAPQEDMPAYLSAVVSTANVLKDVVHIWQIGNEMNGPNEYLANDVCPGQSAEDCVIPAPVYVDRFRQIRTAIKSVPSSLGEQIVLLGPPGAGSSYLGEMLNVINPDDVDGLTLHAYGGTPNVLDVEANVGIFMQFVSQQCAWIDAYEGFESKPVFITEFDRCNDPANDPVQEPVGSRFLQRAYEELNEWNTYGGSYAGSNPHPVRACAWFIYPDYGSWSCYSLRRHKQGARGKDVNLWDAYQYAAAQDYLAGEMTGVLDVSPGLIEREVIVTLNASDAKFEVANVGRGELAFSVDEACPWLSVWPTGGQAASEAVPIAVSFDTAGLSIGVHSATITITAPQAANPVETVEVRVEVLTLPGDGDEDGDVDQNDFGLFQRCMTGQVQNDPTCKWARLDADADVDAADFAIFRGCITGPEVPADLNCVN